MFFFNCHSIALKDFNQIADQLLNLHNFIKNSSVKPDPVREGYNRIDWDRHKDAEGDPEIKWRWNLHLLWNVDEIFIYFEM